MQNGWNGTQSWYTERRFILYCAIVLNGTIVHHDCSSAFLNFEWREQRHAEEGAQCRFAQQSIPSTSVATSQHGVVHFFVLCKS